MTNSLYLCGISPSKIAFDAHSTLAEDRVDNLGGRMGAAIRKAVWRAKLSLLL